MNLRLLGRTLVAGLVAFLVVGVAVTELLSARIEFSVLIGTPAGLVAGALAAALVAWGTSAGAPPQRRRLATACGAFAAGLLLVLALGALVQMGTVVGTVLGVVVGLIAAAAAYLRPRGRTPDRADGPSSN